MKTQKVALFNNMGKVLKVKEWKKFYKEFIFPLKVARTLLASRYMNHSMLNYCKNTIGNVAASLNKLNEETKQALINNPEIASSFFNDDLKEPPENIMPGKISYWGPSSEQADLILEYNFLIEKGGWDIHHYFKALK